MCIRDSHLTCTLTKCHFGREEVSFLGHQITSDGNLLQQQHCRMHRAKLRQTTLQRPGNGLAWKGRRRREPGLYVPPNLRMQVIRHFHDDPETSQLEAEETFRDIVKDYVLTGLTIDVRNYVRGCRVCGFHNRGPNSVIEPTAPSPTQQILEHSRPRRNGPYPLTCAGNTS